MKVVSDTTSTEQIEHLFAIQKANQYAVANASIRERKNKLKALKKAVETTFRQELRDAMMADFKKPQADVDLSEIFPVTSEVKHALSHLSSWASDQPVDTPLALFGSSSYVKYEPKGVCLIIAPWNFPINLTFGPLVSAIAAGNTAILKPSEYTPATSAVIKKIVEAIFTENEVTVVEGGVETSKKLLELPFNHIFFTGAPSIGKVVMQAAAKNLTSVTLELGGKSPTIVDETASIKTAARRIAWGKFLNSGQICIAPDYLFVHESKKEELIEELKKVLATFYGNNAENAPSYTRIVNERHTERVLGYIQDSVLKGANVVHGGKCNVETSYLEPTLVTDVPFDSALMENEIFGPVLPIFAYKNIDEVLSYIQANEKPLALYIYSSKNSNIKHIINNTRAGNTCINNNDVHFFNANLPFGGSNNSGIGKAHGIFGFQSFSEARGIYRQHIPAALELLMPPYTNFKEKLIELTIRFF